LDAAAGKRPPPEIMFDHLMEGIGLALDPEGDRMFVTDFGGSLYSANLDGSNRQTLQFALGNLTGVAYAELHNRPFPKSQAGISPARLNRTASVTSGIPRQRPAA
jgi:hypothetical protein